MAGSAGGAGGRRRGPGEAPRHEHPVIDAAGLGAARHADRLLAAARERGLTRWEAYLAPLPDQLRDAGLRDLTAAARRGRAAYGPKDSIRDALPAALTEPFLESIDILLRELARQSARRD